jgi:DNA-directed RNA polymerase subunit RPC12/RpoP
VIGAAPGGDVQPCSCFNEAKRYVAPSEEVIHRAEEQQAAVAAEVKVEKLCRDCGKDLVGHRRLKDSKGYICVACAKAEEEAAAAGLVRCGECSKQLKPEGLVDYHGTMICKKCYMDHQELSKFKAPPPNLNAHMEEQKRSMKITLIVAGIGAAVLLLLWLGVFR